MNSAMMWIIRFKNRIPTSIVSDKEVEFLNTPVSSKSTFQMLSSETKVLLCLLAQEVVFSGC